MSSRFAAVRTAPLAAQVAEHLRDRVVKGEWPVGTRIPGEIALAGEFEVSRGTIREAVRALTMAGLFEPRVGDGTYVRAKDELSALLIQQVSTGDALSYAMEVREVLETASARSAAQAATSQDIKAMRRALTRRKKANAGRSVPAYVEADAAFHRAIVAASRNPLLLRVYDAIAEIVADSIRQSTFLPEDPRVGDAHFHLVEAIERGHQADASSAAHALYEQVRTQAASPPA